MKLFGFLFVGLMLVANAQAAQQNRQALAYVLTSPAMNMLIATEDRMSGTQLTNVSVTSEDFGNSVNYSMEFTYGTDMKLRPGEVAISKNCSFSARVTRIGNLFTQPSFSEVHCVW